MPRNTHISVRLRSRNAAVAASILLLALGAAFFPAFADGTSPTASPGQVAEQIRGFGPQVAIQVSSFCTFEPAWETLAGRTTKGYRGHAALLPSPPSLVPADRKAWDAMARRGQSEEMAMAPFFPEQYADGALVRSQGMTVMFKPFGATSVRGQVEDGKLVYHGAYKDSDSLQVVKVGQSKEFLLLHGPQSPTRFEYQIAEADHVKDMTLDPTDGAIHFKSDQGKELRLDAPWLAETGGGGRMPGRVRWEIMGSPRKGKDWATVAMVIDHPNTLHYPVLIDPSWSGTTGVLPPQVNENVTAPCQND